MNMENETPAVKKEYETPTAEKVSFSYRQQVVAASEADDCDEFWTQKKGTNCMSKLVSYGN